MTTQYVTTNTISAGAGISYTNNGDSLVVMEGVLLASTSGEAVGGLGFNDITLEIYGIVSSDARLGFLGTGAYVHIGRSGSYTTNATTTALLLLEGANGVLVNEGSMTSRSARGVWLGENGALQNTGLISGRDGVYIFSASYNARVTNSGTIHGNSVSDDPGSTDTNNGIYVEASDALITNLDGGTISSDGLNGAGIRFDAVSGGGLVLNHGMISATQAIGVSLDAVYNGQGVIEVQNFGTIQGAGGAYTGSTNADLLVNRGLMLGDVLMGTGNDTFDARDGRVEGDIDLGAGDDSYDGRGAFVTGTVFGGDGADTFIGNAGLAETFDGGSDSARDTLDFRTLAAAVVALDALFDNDGSAAGDTYLGFENIYGSNRGGDVLRGNASANTLLGFGGNDAIDGADGNDLLRGDGGIDTLTGGLGNDGFRYVSITDIGDTITDFHNVAGDNDRIEIRAAGFGGGLVAGALPATAFVSRADNLAQDADDRFIFRTTDNTLWFDDDGNGADAAVMVADLQAGATFTAADILIV